MSQDIKLYISITSFKEREGKLLKCLVGLKKQSLTPDKIYIYLSEDNAILGNGFTNKKLSPGLKSYIDSNKNIEMFTLYVYKYRDKIMAKNEKLLLETDFVSENSNKDKDSSAFDIMAKLKAKWQSLNNEEKDNIWKYLQVLIKLTDKHIQKTLGNK